MTKKSTAPCDFPGCDRLKGSYKTWCGPHQKQSKSDKPMRLLQNRTGSWTLKTFMERVQPHGDCLRWKLGSGYADCWHDNTCWKAHRLAYHLATGEDITGVPIHHKCAHRWCVKPAHLERASHADNTLEMLGRKAYEAEIALLKARITELEALLPDRSSS